MTQRGCDQPAVFKELPRLRLLLLLLLLLRLLLLLLRRRSLLLLHLSARQEVLTKNDRFKNKQLTNN